jgi:hypothetical protein
VRKGRNDSINNIAIEEVCKLLLISILPFQLYADRMYFPIQHHWTTRLGFLLSIIIGRTTMALDTYGYHYRE